MRKSGVFALAAALFVAASADAHQFGPGYWNAGDARYICILADGTATSTQAGWSGLWTKQTYKGMETATVVGNWDSGQYNDSFVIKGSTFVWNEWKDDLSYFSSVGNLQWLWLGHKCKNGPMK
jgi:hypothetical protein